MVAVTGRVLGRLFYPLMLSTLIAGGMGLRALDVQAKREEAKRHDFSTQIIELLESGNPEYKTKRLEEERKARESLPAFERLQAEIDDINPSVYGCAAGLGLLGTGALAILRTNDRLGRCFSRQYVADLVYALKNDQPEHALDNAGAIGYLLENSSIKIYDKQAKEKCIELIDNALKESKETGTVKDEQLCEKINFLFEKATTKPKEWRLAKEEYLREIRDMEF